MNKRFSRSGSLDEIAGTTPSGCVLRDVGLWTSVGASARNLLPALYVLFLAVFWIGLVSVFVWVALANTFRLATGSVPAWLGSGQVPQFGSSMSELAILWLFLTPFIVSGVAIIFAVFTMLVGHVAVRIRQDRAFAFTGVGPVGWKRRFNAVNVSSVRIGETTWQWNRRTKPAIVITCHDGTAVRLGTVLADERRQWMAKVLRELLVNAE